MTAVLTNNANGATNGATVSSYNSGENSGDAWGYIATNAGATITYANALARGRLSYKFTTAPSAGYGFVEWPRFVEAPNIYIRLNVYLPSYPVGTGVNLCELNDGSSITLRISVNPTGTINLRDASQATMAASTTVVPLGKWFRIEASTTIDASAAQATLRLYHEVDSPYPTEKVTSAAIFNTKPNSTPTFKARFGICDTPVSNFTCYLDDVALSDTNYLGPADQAFLPPLLSSNDAEMGSNATVTTPLHSGTAQNRFVNLASSPGGVSFSNAQASHGSLSYLFQSTNGVDNFLSWTTLATKNAALRGYLYLTAIPTDDTEFFQLTSVEYALHRIAKLGVSAAGKPFLADYAATLWNSSLTLSINTWYRFEMYAAIGATPTTGTMQVAVYALDSTTALTSFNTSTANTGNTDPIGQMRFGKGTATNVVDPFYIDSVAVQQQAGGFIGPYSGTPPPAPTTFAGIAPHLGWGRSI